MGDVRRDRLQEVQAGEVVSRYIVTRRDTSEGPVVKALKKAGVKVYKRMPCDLLCRLDRDPPGVLRALEVKTAQGKRNPSLRLDKRQTEQAEFVAQTGTHYVTSDVEALQALGLMGFGSER